MSEISIIVPVYNVEQYLENCIESILNQTFKDFELILVDDGSTDNSGKICDIYKKKDSRIKVIHKNNGGLSSARNAEFLKEIRRDFILNLYILLRQKDIHIKEKISCLIFAISPKVYRICFD